MITATHQRRARGFTLVEVIIVMVITGILGSGIALFITRPVESYIDSAARAELTDIADLALRRMGRELRLALPNSIVVFTVNGKPAIRFLITKTGGRYLDADAVAAGAPGNALSFTDTAQLSFTMAGAWPEGRQQIAVGDNIVVYNLGPGFDPADAYSGNNVAAVTAVNAASRTISMGSNPFAQAEPSMVLDSPAHRFQVVTGTVTYLCNGGAAGTGSLSRFFSPAVVAANPTAAPSGASALLANMVSSCLFDYATLPNVRSALVGLQLNLERPGKGEKVQLSYQVHVDNTP